MKTTSLCHYGLAMILAVVTLSGCGKDSPQAAPPPAGRLTQGPVVNATVWADNVDKGVRFVIDPEEVAFKTTTDPITGDFTLPKTPTYNYVLVSVGGTDKLTGNAAIQMVAPAGSKNVTPLTTLVAMDTTGTVQAKLEAMMPAGVKFDTDISVSASPAALMLSKSVETIVSSMTNAINNNSGSTITAAQVSAIQAQTMQNITQELAKPAVTATTLAVPQNLTTSLETATVAAATSINAAGNVTVPADAASTIAASSVTASTVALSIPASGAATTAANESLILTPTVVATLNTATAAVTTAAELTVVAAPTPVTYVPPPVQVVTPVTVAPPLGSQTIGAISFTPAVLNIGGTTTVSASATSGLAVVFTSASPAVCSVSGTTVTGLTDGMCLISANQNGNTTYAAANQEQAYLIIRANQTISAITINPATLAVGGTTTAAATSTSGLEVTFNSSTPAVCTVSGSTVTAIAAGNCTITADQIGSTNYVSALQTSTVVPVAKGGQTISVTAAAPLSPAGSFTVAATATSGLPVSYSSATPAVCSNVGGTFTMLAAGTCTVNYNQTGDANYNAAAQVSNSTVATAQTIGAISFSPAALFAGNSGTASAVATSGLPVVFTSATPAVCTVSGSAITAVTPGTCTINANQAGNLSTILPAAPVSASLTVSQNSQSIIVSATAPASALALDSFTVAATATSGLPVTYSSGSPSVCTNVGGLFTMSAAPSGPCIVQFNQAGNTNFAAATQISNTTVVNKRDQAIGTISTSATGSSTISLSATSYGTITQAATGVPVTFSSASPTVCTVSGSTVTAIANGTCTVAANAAANATWNAANTRFLTLYITTVLPSNTGGSSTYIF